MNILTFTEEGEYPSVKKRNILLGAILIIPIFLIVLSYIGFSPFKFLLLISIPFIFLSILSFEITLFIFISSLFFVFYISYVHISIFLVIPLFFSYIVTNKKFDISSSLLLPFTVYFLTIIPSLYNSIDILKTLFRLQNLISLFFLALILHNYIDDLAKIRKVFIFLFIFCFANALYTIIIGLSTGYRFWGFAGIVHVDYLNLFAFTLVLITLIVNGYRRFFSIIISIIFFLVIIISQTRSMFLTFGVTFIFLIIYLFFNNEKYDIKKVRILFLFFLSIILGLSLILISIQINPEIFQRVGQLENVESQTIEKEQDFGTSSLFTRILVWHTAYNAYISHPYIGIGAYSFPFESKNYHQLTSDLYDKYVKGLTPHLTYIAVLTETGILGFTGFIFLLIFLVRFSYKNLKKSDSSEEKFYALILFFAQVYIIVSMFITDAWLWGQCGLLWAIVMGCTSGMSKITKAEMKQE